MNIGRSDIDWKSLSHNEIDRIIAERIEADNKRIEANGGKKSKRAGYILERIAEINNLREADKEAQDGKVKKNRFIRRHNLHPEEDLRALQLMILTLDFPAPDYSVMRVKSDAGKVRDIVKQKYFPWRILHHAIMRVIKGIKQSGRTKDGKKFFDVKETRLMDILNVPITVVDFETNVKTKQGEGRYCVLFEQNGQRSKFITNCYNLKDVLDQAREAENNGQKIFPVENVIVKRRSLGDGKSAYYFEE